MFWLTSQLSLVDCDLSPQVDCIILLAPALAVSYLLVEGNAGK
jgi:hypothetical protein